MDARILEESIARNKKRENVQRCVNEDKLVNEEITKIVHALTVAKSEQEIQPGDDEF